MRLFVDAMDEAGYADMTLCPETMGKVNQLGTLDEVLALCGVDKRITPCIDFGHLNARTQGGLATKADYAAVLDRMADVLQDDRAAHFHAHFSKIEYTAGGEKQHLTFEDAVFGPQYEPLLDLLYERSLAPVIICESAGTQSEDAAAMSRYYAAL
jgi:deoxyribonuclease-4